MKFYEIVDQVAELLQHRGRVAYRALKVEFALNDEQLAALKEELIDIQEIAVDKDNKMLVWVGAAPIASSKFQVPSQDAELRTLPRELYPVASGGTHSRRAGSTRSPW